MRSNNNSIYGASLPNLDDKTIALPIRQCEAKIDGNNQTQAGKGKASSKGKALKTLLFCFKIVKCLYTLLLQLLH